MEQVEQNYTESISSIPGAADRKDLYMMNQWVLLGGLEECMLMSRAVIIRTILLALMKKNQCDIKVDKASICKSIVQMIAPHGRQRACDIVEWSIEWECNEMDQDSRVELVSYNQMLNGESSENPSQELISPHLVQIMLLVHSKENKVLHNAIENWLILATEDPDLNSKFDLVFGLDEDGLQQTQAASSKNQSIRAWIDVACHLLVYLSKNIDWLYGSLSRFTGFLLTFCQDTTNTPQKRLEGELWVSNWLIAHLVCPVLLLTPSSEFQQQWSDQWKTHSSFRTSILTTNTDDSFGEKRRHLYVLLASMLRWLTTQTRNPQDPHSEKELASWWRASSIFRQSIMSAIINVRHSSLTDDSPIQVTASRRARSIWTLRSVLQPEFIQMLKKQDWNEPQPEKDQKFQKFRFRTVQEDLASARMETVHYSLADRVKTSLAIILKECFEKKDQNQASLPKSQSLPRDLRQSADEVGKSEDAFSKAPHPHEKAKSATLKPTSRTQENGSTIDQMKLHKSSAQMSAPNTVQEKRGFLHLLRHQFQLKLSSNQRDNEVDDDDEEQDTANGSNVMINVKWENGKQSSIRLSGHHRKFGSIDGKSS